MVGATAPGIGLKKPNGQALFACRFRPRLVESAPAAMHQPPKSKSGQLIELLRNRILAGEWAARMPAERQLAEEYFVSRTTLRAALQALTFDGLLKNPPHTRGGRALERTAATVQATPRRGEAVILTPSLRESPVLWEHLAILRERLGAAGIPLHVREAARLTEEANPVNSLRRWADAAPETVWILHKMPVKVQHAAQQLGLKAIVFGTAFPEIELPQIDVDFRAVARHATGRCLARGHRKLAVLVHRTSLAGDAEVIEGVREELARYDAPPPLVLKHDFNRARLIDTLDHRLVPAAGRPEVLLVVNQHHLLTTLPHLLRRGLRIPEDLSLIYLSNDPAVERLSPLPERYDLGERLLGRLAAAAQARLAGEIPASSRLLPRLLKGETLG
jgi:DNA-binding LacI/PurR family transcriptional regulator